MLYVSAAESGDGAIVDISVQDSQLLRTVCRELGQAVGSDHILAQTGYTEHAYDYLSLWMVDNRPDPRPRFMRQQQAYVRLKEVLGSPTPSELLLATKVGDSDTPTVRWNLSLTALRMFDGAIRGILDDHGDDDPPFWELPIITGYDEGDFLTLQQEIKVILEAVELAAQPGVADPSVVSVTNPSLQRGDDQSVMHSDEVVAVEYGADSAPPSKYIESLILTDLAPIEDQPPREVEPSPGRIVPPQPGQTDEDADPDPSSEGKSTRIDPPHFISMPPRIHSRRITIADYVDLLRPKKWRRQKGRGDP